MINSSNIFVRIAELEEQKKLMLDYLKMKLDNEDYHGVEDAASDIRDIEAAIHELEMLVSG